MQNFVAKQHLNSMYRVNGLTDFVEQDIFVNLRTSIFKCAHFQVFNYLL